MHLTPIRRRVRIDNRHRNDPCALPSDSPLQRREPCSAIVLDRRPRRAAAQVAEAGEGGAEALGEDAERSAPHEAGGRCAEEVGLGLTGGAAVVRRTIVVRGIRPAGCFRAALYRDGSAGLHDPAEDRVLEQRRLRPVRDLASMRDGHG